MPFQKLQLFTGIETNVVIDLNILLNIISILQSIIVNHHLLHILFFQFWLLYLYVEID